MRKIIVAVALITSSLLPAPAPVQAGPIAQRVVAFYLKMRNARCLVQQIVPATTAQADPMTISLLTRIADQQGQLLTATQVAAVAQQQPRTDPQMVMLLQQLSNQQERILAAIQQGKTSDPALTAMLQQMVLGQQQLLSAIQNQPRTNCPPGCTCPVLPPTHPGTTPAVVVVPPATGTNPGTAIQTLPAPGATLQTLPLPGGALQVLPPAGGSLQAVPGPGGSLQVLPGGVTPPKGTTPTAGATPGVTPLPGGGAVIQPVPGGGGIQVLPVNPSEPMQPLPGAGTPTGTVFRTTTYPARTK